MNEREALKLALEALKNFGQENSDVCKSIKEVLAQPEQEPVAYTGNGTAGREEDVRPTGFFFQMPPQRKPLTEEELSHIYEEYHDCYGQPINANENGWAYERAIEAAHGIKGDA